MAPSLDHSLLAAAPVEVYKTDARSTVWRVETPGGPMVVKRFEYSPLRQALGRMLGLHPAQREACRAQQLIRDGFPVVPIAGTLAVRSGMGCKVHLVTPYTGESLQRLLRGEKLNDEARRRAVLMAVGELAARLIAKGWRFRDFKTANLVIDDAGGVHLIDVGSARRSGSARRKDEMLEMLQHTLEQDGVKEAEQKWWRETIGRG